MCYFQAEALKNSFCFVTFSFPLNITKGNCSIKGFSSSSFAASSFLLLFLFFFLWFLVLVV